MQLIILNTFLFMNKVAGYNSIKKVKYNVNISMNKINK